MKKYMIYSLHLVKKFPWQKKKNKKTTRPDLVDETGTTFFPFFFLASLLISYKPKWNDIKKVKLVHRGHKVHKESYIHKYHLSENITQVNSAFHVRWFIHWEVISKYYSLPSRQKDKINFQPFFYYNFDRNKLTFLVSEKIYSPQCWWIVVDINWATEGQGKFLPLFTSTEVKYIVNYLF